MDEQFLDFEMSPEIIATIKRHRASPATMAKEIVDLRRDVSAARRHFENEVKLLAQEQEEHTKTRAELEATRAEIERLTKVEDYARNIQAEWETLRTWAQDYKDMQRAYRHASNVGCAVEWLGENAEHHNLILANILDRLTRGA